MKTRRTKGGNFTLASVGSAAASAILPLAFFLGARALLKSKKNKTRRR